LTDAYFKTGRKLMTDIVCKKANMRTVTVSQDGYSRRIITDGTYRKASRRVMTDGIYRKASRRIMTDVIYRNASGGSWQIVSTERLAERP
jgi:hypothetical protein